MDPSQLTAILQELGPIAAKLLVIGVIFVAVLRAGVSAWAKLGKNSNIILGTITLISMGMLYPYVILTTLFHPYVFPSFLILHICGGTLVCSVIAKWVEDKARKDLELEKTAVSQPGE